MAAWPTFASIIPTRRTKTFGRYACFMALAVGMIKHLAGWDLQPPKKAISADDSFPSLLDSTAKMCHSTGGMNT